MKDTFYFPHDFSARNDPKLQNLLMDHGCEGIGIYWSIIEMIYEQGGSLPLSNCKGIAFSLHTEIGIIERIINDFDLFSNDGTIFWSDSVKRRLEKMSEISEKRRRAGKLGWQKSFGNNKTNDEKDDGKKTASVRQMPINYTASVRQAESKCSAIKEIKIKENKDNNISISKELDISEEKISSPSIPTEELIPETKKEKNKNNISAQKVVDLWNSICYDYAKVLHISESRKNKIAIRVKEMGGDEKAKDVIKHVFELMQESKFMRGDNPRGWKASFDWVFTNDTNWVKIYEGRYNGYKEETRNSDGGAFGDGKRTDEINEIKRRVDEAAARRKRELEDAGII